MILTHKNALFGIFLASLLLSLLWFYFDRGFEPIISALASVAALVETVTLSKRKWAASIVVIVVALILSVMLVRNYDVLFKVNPVIITVRTTDETGEAVNNAEVLLFNKGVLLSQFTDSNGVASFTADSNREDARIIVEHEDYKIYEHTVYLTRSQELNIQLEQKDFGNRNIIVRVIDDSTNRLIEGAQVILIVDGKSFEDSTDSNGISRFLLEFSGQTIDVELQVTTEDYETSFKTITLQSEHIQDVRLNPLIEEIVKVDDTGVDGDLPQISDKRVILALIEKEAKAVLTKDLELIEEIFAPDATKNNAASSESWNAITRYEETFRLEDHHDINHANVEIEIDGNTAVATNDSCGSFTISATNQEITYSGPKSDRWEFAQDGDGRWWISSLTFGIKATVQPYVYDFEDGTHGCWYVRTDSNVPQGFPPYHTDEMSFTGTGALYFPFDLAETQNNRAQIKYENMPFAGTFSAYVYAPPDAPTDLIASFYAMEYAVEPYNYHGIDSDGGQIVELIPGQWTEVRWEGDVSGWVSPVHLLGIEIRQEGEGSYDGYVLIDNIVINSH